jgi:superfamily II DNA or RNA helicase
MVTDPRDAWQTAAYERTRELVREGVRSILIQSPTGAGKGQLIVRFCAGVVARNRRALVIVPLIVLADDMVLRLTAAGLRAGIMQADSETDANAPIQVATIHTLNRRALPDVDVVVVDEARHAASADLRAILAKYDKATLLGFDATPERADGKPLGDVFEQLIHGPQVRELIAIGALVPVDVYALDSSTDKLADDPIAAYEAKTPNGRAIVFCEDVAHAQRVYETAWTRGHHAALIVGGTSRKRRQEILASNPKIIVGVSVMREGWDYPPIDVVILGCACDHVSGFLQRIGRGLRSYPGKTRCTVLDLRGSVHTLGLPDEDRTWALTTGVVRSKPASIHRCLECGAVFRESPPCPRCGVGITRATKVRAKLSAAEKLAKIEAAPPSQRDKLRFEALRRQACMWAGVARAKHVAATQFKKKYGYEYRGAA